MTVTFTDIWNDRWTVQHVEQVRLVGRTTVELKTFGNEPATTRNIASFTVEYTAVSAFEERSQS